MILPGLEQPLALWHEMLMNGQKQSGGFFIMAAILIGFVWGIFAGDALKGVVIGSAVGVAIAVLIWISDRGDR